MANPERKLSTENLTKWSKRIDITTALVGFILGGSVGYALIMYSALTYVAADIIEKRKKVASR